MTAVKPSIERLHELFLIPDDGRIIRRIDRSSDFDALAPYSERDEAGYILLSVDGFTIRAHSIVFAMTRGKWPKGQIDHINGVKDDNLPGNLRDATVSENGFNRGPQKNSSSGVKGVHWCQQRKKWKVGIMVNRKAIYLGLYDDLEMAGYAYISASLKYHGEYARAA